jgi:hypothetical protein
MAARVGSVSADTRQALLKLLQGGGKDAVGCAYGRESAVRINSLCAP